MKIELKKYNNIPLQVKASFWYFVCLLLQKGITVLMIPIYTRIMNTEEFGEYNIFNSWLGIVTIFITLNLSAGVYTQGLVKFDDKRKELSASLQGLTFFLVLFSLIIYLLFYKFWNNLFSLSCIEMILMFILIWANSIFGFWSTSQRVDNKYVKLVIITIATSVAIPITSIMLMLNFNNKVLARIVGITITSILMYIFLFIFQIIEGKKIVDYKFWKYAILYNLPLIPHYLSQVILNNADHIMIGRMVNNSKAGIYSLAYSLASLILFFIYAINSSLSPWIYRKIKSKEINKLSNIAYISLILVAFAAFLIILFAPEIISLFAPSEYYEAIYVVPPVVIGLYFTFCYELFAKFAFYYEKTFSIMLITVTGALANIILNYIFINMFGYLAAGYTTLICYLIYAIGHYLYMNKVCDEKLNGIRPYDYKILLLIIVTFTFFCFVLMFTYKYVFIRYGVVFSILIVCIFNKRIIKENVNKIINLKILRKESV